MNKGIITGLILFIVGCSDPATTDDKPSLSNDTGSSQTQDKYAEPVDFKNQSQRISYALAALQSNRMMNQSKAIDGVELDAEMLKRGFADGLSDKSALTAEEMQTALAAYQSLVRQSIAREKQQAIVNKQGENESYLAINAKRQEVKQTESGLQYEVLKAGDEKTFPDRNDIVKVNYVGTLVSGRQFDSSFSRGNPSSFPLDRVIRGWTEGIQLMSKGSKYRFYVPPKLGYGAKARPKIPANSVLIFEIELLDIKQREAEDQ